MYRVLSSRFLYPNISKYIYYFRVRRQTTAFNLNCGRRLWIRGTPAFRASGVTFGVTRRERTLLYPRDLSPVSYLSLRAPYSRRRLTFRFYRVQSLFHTFSNKRQNIKSTAISFFFNCQNYSMCSDGILGVLTII